MEMNSDFHINCTYYVRLKRLFFCPEVFLRLFYDKGRERIYMCCQWMQTAGISALLWPCGRENSLRSMTELTACDLWVCVQ